MSQQQGRTTNAGRSPAILLFAVIILTALGGSSMRPPELSSSEVPSIGVITDYDFAVIEECGQCYYDEDSNEHIFGYIPWWPGQLMDCNAFNNCHPNAQPGLCENSHWPCSGFAALQRQLEDAIAEDNGEGLAQLVYYNASLVKFDPDKLQLVLPECEESTERTVSISGDMWSDVQARLVTLES